MRILIILVLLIGAGAGGFVLGQRAERAAIETGDQLSFHTNMELRKMLEQDRKEREEAIRRGDPIVSKSIQMGFVRYTTLRGIANSKGEARFAVDGDYAYLYDPTCEVIWVPGGFMTDFASIPAFARIFFNPSNYAEAALTHDWLYATGNKGDEAARKKADDVFRAALTELGKSSLEVSMLYRAVRLGGSNGFGRPDDYVFFDKNTGQIDSARPRPARVFMPASELQGTDRQMFGQTACIK